MSTDGINFQGPDDFEQGTEDFFKHVFGMLKWLNANMDVNLMLVPVMNQETDEMQAAFAIALGKDYALSLLATFTLMRKYPKECSVFFSMLEEKDRKDGGGVSSVDTFMEKVEEGAAYNTETGDKDEVETEGPVNKQSIDDIKSKYFNREE